MSFPIEISINSASLVESFRAACLQCRKGKAPQFAQLALNSACENNRLAAIMLARKAARCDPAFKEFFQRMAFAV